MISVEKGFWKPLWIGRMSTSTLCLVSHILIFCFSYQGRITKQLYRLGCSYDWDRVAFTMNEVCCVSIYYFLKSSNILFSRLLAKRS